MHTQSTWEKKPQSSPRMQWDGGMGFLNDNLMTTEDHWQLQSGVDPGHLWDGLCINVSWLKMKLHWFISTQSVTHAPIYNQGKYPSVTQTVTEHYFDRHLSVSYLLWCFQALNVCRSTKETLDQEVFCCCDGFFFFPPSYFHITL